MVSHSFAARGGSSVDPIEGRPPVEFDQVILAEVYQWRNKNLMSTRTYMLICLKMASPNPMQVRERRIETRDEKYIEQIMAELKSRNVHIIFIDAKGIADIKKGDGELWLVSKSEPMNNQYVYTGEPRQETLAVPTGRRDKSIADMAGGHCMHRDDDETPYVAPRRAIS